MRSIRDINTPFNGIFEIKRIKGGDKMILFLILLLTLVILTVITVAVISVTGAVGVVLFGDVIVCIWLIVWFMKRIIWKRKK